MKKLTFTSVFSQLLLLLFVIAWIVPTFGLFISSLRDKDVLAISGWWTSFTTTEVNEIYRTKGKEDQIKEGDYYFIKSNLFDENQGKEIYRFGITSKNIDEYEVGETALFKDDTEITVFENGDYVWKSREEYKKKKGKRIFVSAKSPYIHVCSASCSACYSSLAEVPCFCHVGCLLLYVLRFSRSPVCWPGGVCEAIQ